VTLGTGKYTKIGRFVSASVDFYGINITSLSAGGLSIQGFPFTENGNSASLAYIDITGAVSAAQGRVVVYMTGSTTATMYLSQNTSAGVNQIQKSDLNASAISIRFNGTYMTA
jgi:hypothetical protein